MQIPGWLQKLYLWVVHFIGWTLLNILLGSFPFFQTMFREGKDDPFQIGLLCFCFSVVSSGLYTTLVNSQSKEHSGFAKAGYTVMMSLTIVWIVAVWSIVLMLPDILAFIGDETKIKNGLYALYFTSILLFFCANRKSLSDLVNYHLSKKLITETVTNSKVKGASMGTSLNREEGF